MFIWVIVCETVTLHCLTVQFILFIFTPRICHIWKEEEKLKQEENIKKVSYFYVFLHFS